MKKIDRQGCGPMAMALHGSYTAELFSLEARMLPFDSGSRQSLAAPGLVRMLRWGAAGRLLLDDMTPVSKAFL